MNSIRRGVEPIPNGNDKFAGTSKGRTPAPARRPIAPALSVMAVVLSALALTAMLSVPRAPAPAPGTIMASNSRGGPVTIGAACTHYPGAEIAIQPRGAGTVVVGATVGVGVNHTFGMNDEARIVVSSSATDCTLNNYTAFVSVPASLPTDPFHFATVPLLRPFVVSASATVTFYVNGVMASGGDAGDRFDSASLVAVYYES